MSLKVNHQLIRSILSSIGITIFILSVFFKLKDIFLYGGTKRIKENGETDDESDVIDEDDEYGEDEKESVVEYAESPTGCESSN